MIKKIIEWFEYHEDQMFEEIEERSSIWVVIIVAGLLLGLLVSSVKRDGKDTGWPPWGTDGTIETYSK